METIESREFREMYERVPRIWEHICGEVVHVHGQYRLDYVGIYEGDALMVAITRPELGSLLMVAAKWGSSDISDLLMNHIKSVWKV